MTIENSELCLLVDNHLVVYNGSHTFNIVWIGGHGQSKDLYCFTNYNINSDSPISKIKKAMLEGYEHFNYEYINS
tara:strand:- start:636 stop:860 length:225 start_codon:yes stop_codon:yes gene_type:complete